jgi:phospholipid/cholesterol/gamma-HCH transport system permease protein
LIKSLFHRHFFFKNLLHSLYLNGFCSIPVVGLTGIFTGAVLTVQLFDNLHRFGLDDMIPYIVMFSLMKELAPVLCGLMIVARVSSSMSAEIGSMKTNNQIDVLTSMSISPYRFLYAPRIISMIIAQPILTTIAIIMGVAGSFIVSCNMYGFTDVYFLNLVWEDFEWSAYIMGITKGAIFGALLSIIASYKGNQTQDGAVGIKKTTISSVVISCVFILMFNFIITAIMS